jgi:hypothetical protein
MLEEVMAGSGSTTFMTPAELRKISQDAEMAELRASLAKMRKDDEEHKKMRESFMTRDVRPDAVGRVMTMLQRAAERGQSEVMIMQFPSEYCSDRGRAINNFEHDWSETLEGVAKRGYEIFQAEFKPKGYKLRAQILDYPGGMLGDVGIFLSW